MAIIAAINSFLYILGFTGTRIVMLPNFIENNEGAIALASWSFTILGFVVKPYLDKKIFSTDKEELRLQVEKNLLEED